MFPQLGRTAAARTLRITLVVFCSTFLRRPELPTLPRVRVGPPGYRPSPSLYHDARFLRLAGRKCRRRRAPCTGRALFLASQGEKAAASTCAALSLDEQKEKVTASAHRAFGDSHFSVPAKEINDFSCLPPHGARPVKPQVNMSRSFAPMPHWRFLRRSDRKRNRKRGASPLISCARPIITIPFSSTSSKESPSRP